MPFKRLPARGMGPLGGFERAATPARLRARPVHFKSNNLSALGAGLTKYPSAPRGSPKCVALERAPQRPRPEPLSCKSGVSC